MATVGAKSIQNTLYTNSTHTIQLQGLWYLGRISTETGGGRRNGFMYVHKTAQVCICTYIRYVLAHTQVQVYMYAEVDKYNMYVRKTTHAHTHAHTPHT